MIAQSTGCPVTGFNNIYNMDCIEGMRKIPDNSIDLVITDPPFAIEFKAKRSNYNRSQTRVLEGYQEIPKEKYYEFTLQWMKEVYRLLKEPGSMYVFSGWNNLKDILIALDELGFITVNHLIWKYQFGVVTQKNSLLHIIIVYMFVRMNRKGNFFLMRVLVKAIKKIRGEVCIIKIRKMFGI